jgi:flagellar protein FliJ
MSKVVHDRGLRAVRRVREVRERDSLLGLRRATEEHLELLARVEDLDSLMGLHTSATPPAEAGEWVTRRAAMMAVAAAASKAQADADAAATVRQSAQEHWASDRSRLRAVETLLERRAEARRAERDRAVARELDDLGGQRWLRAQESLTAADGGSVSAS